MLCLVYFLWDRCLFCFALVWMSLYVDVLLFVSTDWRFADNECCICCGSILFKLFHLSSLHPHSHPNIAAWEENGQEHGAIE